MCKKKGIMMPSTLLVRQVLSAEQALRTLVPSSRITQYTDSLGSTRPHLIFLVS